MTFMQNGTFQLRLNIDWVLAEINDFISCTNASVDIKMFPLLAIK